MQTIHLRDLQRNLKKILANVETEVIVLRNNIPLCKIVPLDADSALIKEQWRIDRIAALGQEVPLASSYPLDDDLGNLEGFEQEISEKDDFFRSELLKEDNEKGKR